MRPSIEPRKTLPSCEILHALYAYDAESGALTLRNSNKRRRAGDLAGHVTTAGYRRVCIGGDENRFLAHRIVWKMVTGEEPPEFIDHIDGDGQNNAWGNLRAADATTNGRNVAVHKRNRLGVKGVSVCGTTKKFAAYIRENGRNVLLGRFDDVGAAKVAYQRKAESLFGEFHRGGAI